MARALIGHTGFVGGNLKAQGAYDDFYNTSNIESIAGREYELIVSAGAPAAKWIANKDPVADLLAIQRLENALSQVQTRRFVLISTVDVYPRPFGVDESSEIDFASCEPYGRNRLLLEAFVTERFPRATILRLPGLFGPGLKKNLVFDLLNENRLDLVHQNGQFQFYDLANIGRDVQMCLDKHLAVVNFATEPVTARQLARQVFARSITNELPAPPPRYDFHTLHADAFGRTGPYIASRDEVLSAMKRFVEATRAAKK